MKYVLAEVDEDKSITIEEITDRPLEYVSDFEPIDVVNGKMVVWSETGIKYEFGPIQEVAEKKLTNSISIVDVGSWSTGGPELIKLKDDDSAALRAHLLGYLRLDDEGQPLTELVKLAENENQKI